MQVLQAIAKCRKVGAANWGKRKRKQSNGCTEDKKGADLKRWFKEKWVDVRTGKP